MYEIQLGEDQTQFIPEVLFYWSEGDKTYQSQQGKSGDHFRVVEDWQDIEEIIKTGSFSGQP